jgi:hypothetical protein
MDCVLQDDVVKFISDPPFPPQHDDAPEEGKGKVKECREVGEGDDTVTIEDISNDEDEETLQEWFQMRSRFIHPGLPNVPLIVESPARLEASIPVPPKKPRNVVRKRTAKKLKITETTNQEVSTTTGVVEYFSDEYYALTVESSSVTGYSFFGPRGPW